jgi:hypothetical protein
MTDAVMSGRWAPVAALCWGLFSFGLAQGQNTASVTPRSLDHIVALVNSDPITNSEFRQRLLKVQSQIKASGATPPAADALNAQVLEQLVLERVQLQRAQELGLRVDADTVDDAKRRLASQNGLSLAAFEHRLQSQGISPEAFAFDLREQLLLQRLRDREADARAKVSETEIDEYIAEQQRLKPLSNLSLHLAQILLPVPAGGDTNREAAVRAQADAIAAQARAGQDFAQLAKAHSKSNERGRVTSCCVHHRAWAKPKPSLNCSAGERASWRDARPLKHWHDSTAKMAQQPMVATWVGPRPVSSCPNLNRPWTRSKPARFHRLWSLALGCT